MNDTADLQGAGLLDRFGPGELHIETVWEDDARSGYLVSEASTNAAPVFIGGREFIQLKGEIAADGRAWSTTEECPSGRMFRHFMMGGDIDSGLTGKPAYEVLRRQAHGAFDIYMAVYIYPGQEGEPTFSLDLHASADAVEVESAPSDSGLGIDQVVPVATVRDAIRALRYAGGVTIALHGNASEIRQLEAGLLAPSQENAIAPGIAC